MLPASTETKAATLSADQVKFGKGRAGHDDGFAERDDDEERAALGHVAAFDHPVRDGGRAIARNPEPHRRRDVFDHERDRPKHEPRSRPRASPPAIQNTADTESQAAMRMAFMRARGRDGGVETHRKIVLPTCIAA